MIHRDGPDSFLEAAFRIKPGSLNLQAPGVREELAVIMAWNRQLMELRLALAERAYPCDQEMLLRRCLINGQLTLAGEQLLNPARPQRAVTAADMKRWFHPSAYAQGRDAAAVAAEGISVVDAYRLAGPLRPTVAGTELMGAHIDQFLRWRQRGAQALLEQTYPELVYAFQSGRALRDYLRMAADTFSKAVSAEIRQSAHRFSQQAAVAERVEMPPDWYAALPRQR